MTIPIKSNIPLPSFTTDKELVMGFCMGRNLYSDGILFHVKFGIDTRLFTLRINFNLDFTLE